MPFAATRIDLEIVILSEVREKQVYDITYIVESKQLVQMNLFTKESQMQKTNMVAGEKGREG